MQLKKLERSVLKLWYTRAGIGAAALLSAIAAVWVILVLAAAETTVLLAVGVSVSVPLVLITALVLLLPYFRYSLFSWGYDEKTIVVQQGVIFRKRVVIPICQIQDLHREQGPLMMAYKLADVTISTAGSNFTLSTLSVEAADEWIATLEQYLETRIEELRHEEI